MIGRKARAEPARQDGRAASAADVSAALVALAGGEASDGDASRGDVVRSAVGTVGRGARGAGLKALTGGRWLADTLADVAPRLPVRSAETLHAQHPGRDTDEIARRLVGAAVKAATAVGVAGGALAAVQWTAPPTLLSAPAQLAAETLAIAVIEVKLVAELHELYGIPAPGGPTDRGLAYLSAWSERKGLDPANPKSMAAGLGSTVKRQIRRRVVGRFGRNVTTLGPMLTGAVLGGAINRHETRTLAAKIQADVRVAAAQSRAAAGR